VESLDGKHVNIQCLIKACSAFYNYKRNNCIVLLALVEANYKFAIIDVGSYGRNSDGNIFAKSSPGKSLQNETLILPADVLLTKNGEPQPHVVDEDEAFPLKPYLLRPYNKSNVTGNEAKKVFNYRRSRATRDVENAFGILTARWRVFRRSFQVQPEMVDNIVLTCCCLHNMLSQNHDFEPDYTYAEDRRSALQNTEPLRRNHVQRAFSSPGKLQRLL
jgi:hypothetical protein